MSREAYVARSKARRIAALLRDESVEPMLAGCSADELARYESELVEVLFSADAKRVGALARAAVLLPVPIAARIAQRALGPWLCARLTGELAPPLARQIAEHFDIAFLAELAGDLDPRRASTVVSALPVPLVRDVAAALAAAGQHVAMARFVPHLGEHAVAECLGVLTGADILRLAFVMDSPEQVRALVEQMSREQVSGLAAVSVSHGLQTEFAAMRLSCTRTQRRLLQSA